MSLPIIDDADVFAEIGEAGFEKLVAAFYRQVPHDDILGPMYPPADLVGAEIRLRDFLVGRFGGPSRYVEQRGHPRLRMRHARVPIDDRMRDAWMRSMRAALDESALPSPDRWAPGPWSVDRGRCCRRATRHRPAR